MMLATIIPRTGRYLLFAAAFLAAATPGHAQLGIGAGLNFNSLDDIRTDDGEAAFERSTGYHMGVFYGLGLGPVNLRPGVFYHRVGEFAFPDGQEIDLSAVEIPLDVRINVLTMPVATPYLLGAPVLSFGRTGSDFSDAVEDMNLSADLGIGVELSLPGLGIALMPELRYGIAVTDYLSESFEVGGTTVTPTDGSRRPSKVMLRLNVMF